MDGLSIEAVLGGVQGLTMTIGVETKLNTTTMRVKSMLKLNTTRNDPISNFEFKFYFPRFDPYVTKSPSINPLGPYSVQSVGAALAVSWAIEQNPG